MDGNAYEMAGLNAFFSNGQIFRRGLYTPRWVIVLCGVASYVIHFVLKQRFHAFIQVSGFDYCT